jgi:hypothetical protein
MASRKEQKEALRAERERKAREAEAAERRRRMVGFGAAGVLVVAALAAIVVVLVTSGGGDDGGGGGDGAATANSGEFQKASIPAANPEAGELSAAAKAAGCKFSEHPNEGRGHVSGRVEYKTNPPNSGNHNEFPAEDGAYTEQVAIEELVHSLEHGRVILWYRPDASPQLKGQLKALFDEDTFHMLLAPNDRKMPSEVAASSWTRTITCQRVNDKTWDALRAFRDQYRDQAPEQVP